MATGMLVACLRLHNLYTKQDPQGFGGPGWLIAFIVCDGFMLISVIALAVMQASQVRLTPQL